MKYIILPQQHLSRQDTIYRQDKQLSEWPSGTSENVRAIYAIDRDWGAFVGEDGVIGMYNPDILAWELTPESGTLTIQQLYALSPVSEDNVVMVGTGGFIGGYNGTEWYESSDSPIDPNITFTSCIHYGIFLMAGGYDTSTGDQVIYHKGYYLSGGAYAYHYHWTEVYRGKIGAAAATNAIWKFLWLTDGSLPDISEHIRFIAVGGQGTIVTSETWGGSWEKMSSPTTETLLGCTASDKPPAWAVGFNGTVLMYTGETFADAEWREYPKFTDNRLWDVAQFSSDEAYAVGASGEMWMWDGVRWRRMGTDTLQDLGCIGGTHKNFLWVSGSGGYIGQLQLKVWPSPNLDISGNVMDYRQPSSVTIMDAEEIRDAAAHDSSIFVMALFSHCTIKVTNDLDQAVSVQIYGDTEDDCTNPVVVGAAYNVPAGDVDIHSFNVTEDGWYPYMYAEITPAGVPTTGDITVKAVKKPLQ